MTVSAVPYWRLSGYYACYFAYIGVFAPYFGLYLQAKSFSAADIGLLMSQMHLMRLFAPNVWGWVADHSGRRMGIVRMASAVALLGLSGLFFVDSRLGHFIVLGVVAFFWSAALPLIEAITMAHLQGDVGRYSRIRLWGSIGFIVAVMGLGAWLEWAPLATLLPIMLMILGGILVFSLAIPDLPVPPRAHGDAGLAEVLRQPRTLALFAACFLMSVAHGPFYTFYSIHLTDHAYSTTAVGALWSLGVVAEIGVFLGMTQLVHRFSLRSLLLAALLAAVVRFLLMGWGAPSVLAMIFVQILHGMTFGVFHAASIAAVNQWFPPACQSRGQALYSSLCFGGGSLLGTLLSGWAWESWGGGWVFAAASLFALLGFFTLSQGWRDNG